MSPFVFLVLATGRWPEWGSSLLACAAATQDQGSNLGLGDVEIEGPDAGWKGGHALPKKCWLKALLKTKRCRIIGLNSIYDTTIKLNKAALHI